jgi:replicative DNA helicase
VYSQPHNIDCEQQVLGGLLHQNGLLNALADVPPEAFFDPVHGQIYASIRNRVEDGGVADATTLRFEFQDHDGLTKLGGAEYLLRLQTSAVATSMMPDYVKELMALFARRTAMEALHVGLDKLERYEPDMNAETVLSDVEARVSEAIGTVQHKPLSRSFLAGMTGAVDQINAAHHCGAPVGVSTGLRQLDGQIGNMGAGEYLVLAGRPSMGKSALALNVALKAAQRGEGVFFASLEMFDEQLAMRSFSQILAEKGQSVPYFNMRRGDLTDGQFEGVLRTAHDMTDLPIQTCDPSCRSLPRLRAALNDGARRLRAQGAEMKLIVVDYLQLIDPVGRYRSGDTNARVSASSAAMKAMAGHYGCPVMCLSQLSRQVEMRDPPVPILSDLRDSGAIEQDADTVIFCYRPEYYAQKRIDAAKGAGKGPGDVADLEAAIAGQRNQMKLIVAKQRTGPTGTVTVHCEIEKNVVRDLGDDPAQAMMEGFR